MELRTDETSADAFEAVIRVWKEDNTRCVAFGDHWLRPDGWSRNGLEFTHEDEPELIIKFKK